MSYRVFNGRAYQIGSIEQNSIHKKNENKEEVIIKKSFNEVLEEVKVSKHASERMKDLNLSDGDLKKLEDGFKIAKNKGAKNSLMLYKDIAFIANVPNKTVITAVEKDRAKENIFTNIDSVIIL